MNVFIVTFDRASNLSYKEFHNEFVSHPEFQGWWHYIKSCYLIVGDMEAATVSKHFRSVAKKRAIPTRHLVVQVDLTDSSGWLPKSAWDWIRKNSEQ